ncbi:F-box/LRR-repeat protein 13 [Otolemur garnettii]|uniref:F-box/LRR-repeat protein 13 n=1 Tax=Otolemur garnettii TaxID=30611 RepID=UPI000C7F7365|nr:F-box/LRR-repeat protein 13 [Otolemur garnettii]
MTPELMIKACTFYTGRLVKTHFCSWREITVPHAKQDEVMSGKQERAVAHHIFRLQKSAFHAWHVYVKHKKQIFNGCPLALAFSALPVKHFHFGTVMQHEFQLKQWKDKLKLKIATIDIFLSLDKSTSKIPFEDGTQEFDISQLPDRAIAQIFFYLSLRDTVVCSQISHAWLSMTQMSSLWNAIDFSAVKNIITEKYVVSTLQKWRLNVLRLNFRGCLFRPKTFKSVSACKNLQELNVSDCSTLTDESMRQISEGCPGVLYLNLSNTNITNRTMRLLPRYFHNLQNLSLAYCRKFTDKGLQYLNLGNGCHKLIYLDLSGCTQISVQGFKNIASSCSGIMHLTINDMPTLTDNCVKALVEKCLRITSVIFIGAPHISDSTFKALSICSLRKIRFEGNKRITDTCFKLMDKNYPNISHIYMADCKGITDSSLKPLSHLRRLTVLNLANCMRIGDIGIKHFLDGPASISIRELNLSNCVQLTDFSAMKLSDRCYNLNYLSLRNCEHLTDGGLEYIVNILSLVSVDLSGTKISDEGLLILSKHKKLKELSLSECYKITDIGIQAFCRFSLTLEYLDVSYCSRLSDGIIKALAIYCTDITSLIIAGCPKITDSGIEMLSAKCHYVHILDVSGCVLLTDQMLQSLQIGCKQLRILKMQYCGRISKEAALKMSSIVQQQEYSSNDPPRWFGYDSEGKTLKVNQEMKPPKSSQDAGEMTVKRSIVSNEEEEV